MSDFELKLLNIIRRSEDPTKTMAMAADIIQRLTVGEDAQSIAASYGIKLENIRKQDLGCSLVSK